MVKVYLDISAYNRPFDDQTQPKIFLESQAIAIILQMVETQMVELVSIRIRKQSQSLFHQAGSHESLSSNSWIETRSG